MIKRVFYENGWRAEVELVSTEEEDGGVKRTLKVLRTISESSYVDPAAHPKEGETFLVWVKKGFEHYAGWTLNYA